MYRLPPDLTQFLKNKDILMIANIVDPENTSLFAQAWKFLDHLGIPVSWQQDWEGYINALTESHVCIKEGANELIWAPVGRGAYTPKDGYPIIHAAHMSHVLLEWWRSLWKLKAPPLTKLFMWNVLRNKTPTGINLMKRSFFSASWCVLCQQAKETNDHIFFAFPFSEPHMGPSSINIIHFRKMAQA